MLGTDDGHAAPGWQQGMTGTLLDLCLESPSSARAQSRPSSAPNRTSKSRSKAGRPRSPTCGVCGRPAAKTASDLPFDWIKLYEESSNPKHGWKSCKTIRGVDVSKSKGPPEETFEIPPKEFILPPTRPAPRPRRMTRIFQTAEEVEAQVEAWRRRVLGGGRNLRCRSASLVDFVDHVLAGAEPASPIGAKTMKFEHVEQLDPAEQGWNTPKVSRQETRDLPEVAPGVEKALTLDMNATFISAADRFSLNQIFGQLSVNGDLYVDRLAEGIEIHEGKGSDKEWVREILREHFPGRLYLERGDFIDFVNMYRRHRHAFMQKIFSEVDQDGSKTVSLEEIVVLLGRRGITPVLSCVERIFREVTGEREMRDLSFDEFVQIYDVVQARAGFSEHDLVRLRKVWSRYDQDGNQVLSADEVRLALDWQGFVVDSVEVESLVHEVGQRKGLNQHEFLTFMRKYRDNEVQKFMQINEKLRTSGHVGEDLVTLADLPRVLEAIGYEDVAPEVLQECAALVHLVNRDMAVGITSLNPTFTFDGIYHFLENLRASHGFINDERVDLLNAFLRFSTEQFSKSGFIEEDDASSSAPEGDEDAQISVLKLFHALRWLGYQMELWQVVEKMGSIRMVGSATLCQDEFMRVMAVVHKQEIDCIKTMLEGDDKQASSPQGHCKSMSDGHEADGHFQVTARRLKRVFHHLGYPMATQELVSISKEFSQGYYSQDVWGVAQVLRRHRKKVREKVRKNFGFAAVELQHLQDAFEQMGARPGGKLKGKQLSNAVRELFPGAEKDQQERARAHMTLRQVTKSQGNCEELSFQDFLHIVRLRLDCAAEAKLNQEHQALESLNFVPEEVTEFRIIFHKIAREEQGSTATGLFGKVSAIPVLSYAAVEAMLTGIAGQCTELNREALQEVLEKMDKEKKGSLYFWEFLEAVRQLMETNWHNINDEAQKLVFDSWAATEADALYNARLAEFARRMED